jgi:hypothetical protein
MYSVHDYDFAVEKNCSMTNHVLGTIYAASQQFILAKKNTPDAHRVQTVDKRS